MKNDILTLARAGYTKDEISRLLTFDPKAPAETVVSDAPAETVVSDAPAETVAGKKNEFSDLLEKLEKIESRINKENVKKSEIPETSQSQTLGQIMEKLVR